MRERHVRDGLDFLHIEDPQIRLPLVESIQGSWSELMYVGGYGRASLDEHPAQPDAIHDAALHAKATMRRVHWSITTRTQCVRNTADSHRNKSRLHRLSFA